MSPLFRVTRIAIVGVWAALLIALARSHLPGLPANDGGPADLPPLPSARAAADEHWSGIYLRGAKIGYSHGRLRTTADGVRIDESSVMRLIVLEREQTVRLVVTATANPDLTVRRFTATLSSELGRFTARGRVDGARLILDVTTGGEQSRQELPLDEPLYLPSAARARLAASGLRAGRQATFRIFDPSAMQHQPMTIIVEEPQAIVLDGLSIPAWKLRESFRGIESDVWIDATGRMLRERGAMGLEVVRESRDAAVTAGWQDTPVDLMGAVAIPVATDIEAPRSRGRLRAQLGGLAGFPVPSDARQRVAGDTLTIEREAVPAVSYALPYRETQWAAELQPTAFLQTDHPRVRTAARAALGDAREATAAADRLRRWVYTTLEKRPAATIPNALQVLEIRAGDCNEHAVLYAALARAVGLPARVVAGVVYQDGAFLYHAWNEVWLGNDWVSVDPAFDQMPADVTHLKLVEGGPDAHAALMPLIGSLSIAILPEGT